MMYYGIVIALTIIFRNGVQAYTLPTTIPPTTTPYTSSTPQVCDVNGAAFAVGGTYEEKDKSDEMCRVYECEQHGNNQPFAYSHTACYDSTTDKCVMFYSTQMIGGSERYCEPYTDNGRPGWVYRGGDRTTTPPTTNPPPTTTQPQTTTSQGCNLNGIQYPFGIIPNSGGCICDYSGYMICP